MKLNPAYMHPALVEKLPAIELVANCYYANVLGYLINPSPDSLDAIDGIDKRFEAYKLRAKLVYFNITRKTAKTLAGLVFSKYPTVDLPESLAGLEHDIDGAGVTLAQQARRVLIEVLLKGRCGLLADYPVNPDGMTRAEQLASNAQPVITVYEAQDILNWRVEKKRLSMLVLNDTYEASDDGFEIKYGQQVLVLRLRDGIVTAETYQKPDNGVWTSLGEHIMTDSAGRPLTVIPFTFIGADNNDSILDDSPLYDLATLNLAHFRNYADFEDSVHLVGQPTLFVHGLTDSWDSDDTDPIVMGSRNAHLLPLGSTATLLQAEPNNLVQQAIELKERQMLALGAKIIESNSSTKTATEAGADIADESSILTTIANNISDAYSFVMMQAGKFAGAKETDNYVVTLNTNYTSSKLSAQDIQVLLQLWQSKAITFDEFRSRLVENETATIENSQDAKDIIDSEIGVPILSTSKVQD